MNKYLAKPSSEISSQQKLEPESCLSFKGNKIDSHLVQRIRRVLGRQI